MTPYIHFGPAGWSYPDWAGSVYPHPLPKGFDHLAFLGERFDFVEVNTTFYHIPSEKMIRSWISRTRAFPHFSFWIKLLQSFTHQREWGPDETSSFRRSITPLQESGKLQGVLAQFPYSFHYSPENQRHLQKLADEFSSFRFAVEFRHNSWDCSDVLQWFNRNSWIWVNIDQPKISASLGLTDYVTHPEISYVRLHGRNSSAWFSGEGRNVRYDYSYSAMELTEIADMVRRLLREARQIFVSGNNHYKGSAIRNLIELRKMVAEG